FIRRLCLGHVLQFDAPTEVRSRVAGILRGGNSWRKQMDLERQSMQDVNRGIIGAEIKKQGLLWGDLMSQGFDPESLWERVDGDRDLLRELVEIFDQEFPGMLARLEASIQQGDAVDMAKAAHKIKGTLLQFSGKSAAAAAQALELMGKEEKTEGAAPL